MAAKKSRRQYFQREDVKEKRREYFRRPQVRKKIKEYLHKPEVAARRKKVRSSAPFKEKRNVSRRLSKLKSFGLTPDQARSEIAKTLCDCCFQPFGDQTPHIDHDHATNTFRGMVHSHCNTAIGLMKDRVESLVLAARYVDPFHRSPLSVDSGNAYLDKLEQIAEEDVTGLKKAQASYGNSWKQGGGANAFAMLKRKWDRMSNRLERPEINLDIFKGIALDRRGEGLIDDVRDLRRYLLLVEAELRARGFVAKHRDNTKEG